MKRNIIKTIILHIFVITITGGLFCHGYFMGVSLSKYDRFVVYGAADNWTNCDNSDLVTAFRYYCKSRNLALEGSAADALTSFTTTTFNNICSTIGIDPTQLQAELKKTTNGNLGLRYLFSNNGISAYNRIFAEFLQNNDLSVGDEVDDQVVYSGEYYRDPDGNGCLVWNLPSSNNHFEYRNPILWGSTYIYNGQGIKELYNSGVHTLNLNYYNQRSLNTYSRSIYKISDFSVYKDIYALTNGTSSGSYIAQYCHFLLSDQTFNSDLIIFHVNGGSTFYFGNLVDMRSNTNSSYTSNIRWEYFFTFDNLGGDVDDAEISLTTNNTTINNNNYNNNYVIIYNGGDTYISDDDDEPLPTTPPGGGGGGGGDPDNWNPTVPNIPDPENPTFPSIDLPDIDIPNLPSLDFSLGDLRNKFPFSLPFDIIAVLNVLDGEPQAPVIDATIPIGSWYTWEFHADFSEFDNYARIFRAFEFIGFVIGLAVFTVHFAKG